MTDDAISIARQVYEAYVTKDRPAIEALIADDFHFTSPLDNRLDRRAYFARCWKNSETIAGFTFIATAADGDRVFVVYEGRRTAGRPFRNAEVLTVRDGKIVETEVYFGWSPPTTHPSAALSMRERGGVGASARFYFGRFTARSLPSPPPPQKKRSPPSDSSPERRRRAACRAAQYFAAVGSMRRSSLSSPSQVACQSSPSTQVTPVTKRFDSIVRRIAPGLGIDLVDLALAVLPDPQRPFRPGHARGAAFGRRDGGDHAAALRVDLLDAVAGDLERRWPSNAVPAWAATSSRARRSCRSSDRWRSVCRRRRSRHARRRN